ncbi:MAG: CHASE3 domain-containing protein [Sporocytophaga sp.]|uniref:ATP-binding protein n=1 Tax=Sporocytophaga sp. TaxID=2231183 RepID=UPI001B109B54|nr:ATP-binding protein [Sporocytophaga sp.]MBO9700411.1 CHASE3 domain-containing protein [Sporocytophaga sp.]
MKLRLSGKIIASFSLIIIFSFISFGVNLKLSSDVNRDTEYLTKSEAIIRNSAKIHKSILEMQSNFRGYLLTENKSFLDPYYSSIKEMSGLVDEQRKLISDSPAQVARFNDIQILHNQWLKYANALIEAKFKQIDPKIISSEYEMLFEQKLRKEFGKKMTDEISNKFKEFDKTEYRVRKGRRAKLSESIAIAKQVTMLLAIITISVGVLSAFYITHIIIKRIKSMVVLADNISKGRFETIVDIEKDELSQLSDSLNVMSEKLKKSFSELDNYAYVVSHDLKVPLRGIYNLAHWMEEDYGNELSPEMHKYLDKLKGRVERMESLINGLLEYSKIGRTSQPLEEVNMNELLADIIDSTVPEDFEVRLSNNLPVIFTERLRIQQVFSNLISNAVKYKGNKSGLITITSKEVPDGFEFTVEDNGVGISPEYHNKIFGLFQTLREKHEVESTGIGLSIVKKIIEDNKGSIRVVSNEGEGASFIFKWPAIKVVMPV